MKKRIAIALAGVLALSMAACGAQSTETTPTTASGDAKRHLPHHAAMPADGSHSASATARTTAPQTDSPSSAMTGNSSSNILSNASKNSPLLSPDKQLTAYYPPLLLRLIHSVVVYIVLYYTIYFGACPLE